MGVVTLCIYDTGSCMLFLDSQNSAAVVVEDNMMAGYVYGRVSVNVSYAVDYAYSPQSCYSLKSMS